MTRDDLLAFKDRGFFSDKEFAETLGLVEVGNRVCIRRMLGENPGHGVGSLCECGSFRWLDHPIAYRYESSPEGAVDVLAWCPYWTWEEHVKQHAVGQAGLDVFEFAREHDLCIEEFPHGSGWYGMHTVFVVMWKDKESTNA